MNLTISNYQIIDLLTKSHQWQVLKNVLVKVDEFIIPVNFVVLDTETDINMPIIFNRPFLATTCTIIDMKNVKLKFQISKEAI